MKIKVSGDFAEIFGTESSIEKNAQKTRKPLKIKDSGLPKKLFSIVLQSMNKWAPPWNTQKTDKTARSKNAKPLENQGLPQIKQNPEKIFSGLKFWWTIRGSNPGHPD